MATRTTTSRITATTLALISAFAIGGLQGISHADTASPRLGMTSQLAAPALAVGVSTSRYSAHTEGSQTERRGWFRR